MSRVNLSLTHASSSVRWLRVTAEMHSVRNPGKASTWLSPWSETLLSTLLHHLHIRTGFPSKITSPWQQENKMQVRLCVRLFFSVVHSYFSTQIPFRWRLELSQVWCCTYFSWPQLFSRCIFICWVNLNKRKQKALLLRDSMGLSSNFRLVL